MTEMTEKEWMVGSDVGWMLTFVSGRTSERKHRLFGCRCLRPYCRESQLASRAIEVAERLADCEADEYEREAIHEAVSNELGDNRFGRVDPLTATQLALEAGMWAVDKHAGGASWSGHMMALETARESGIYDEERQVLVQVMHCVFGNPFRRMTLDPFWLTPTVISLAKQMYVSQDFSAMPILADALQDAGCSSDQILTHCREPGPHVRGCFVVDLCLNKA